MEGEFNNTMLRHEDGDPEEDPLVIPPPKSRTPSLTVRPVKQLMSDNLTNGFDKDKDSQENSELEERFTFTYSENVIDKSKHNGEGKHLPQAVLKTFNCKSCHQPYEMICRGNLIIKGFCPRCLSGGQCVNQPKRLSNELHSKSPSIHSTDEDSTKTNVSTTSLVICTFCNKSFRFNKAHTEHLKTRYSGKYGCNVCDELFCNSNDLKVHNEAIHKECNVLESSKEMSVVSECKMDVVAPSELMDEKKIEKDEAKDTEVKITRTTKYRRCNLCRVSVPIDKISEHMKSHTIEKISNLRRSSVDKESHETKKEVSNDLVMNKEPIENEKFTLCKYNYLCSLCDESFLNIDSLKTHLMSDKHANSIVLITGISLSCKQCNALFQSINELKSHLNEISHIAEHHVKLNNIAVYRCDSCNKGFINEADYSVHKYLNHKEKNTTALVIKIPRIDLLNTKGEEDNRRVTYQPRKRVVKEQLAETEYKCLTCGASYKSVSSLRKHGTYHSHKIGDFEKLAFEVTNAPVEAETSAVSNKIVTDLKINRKRKSLHRLKKVESKSDLECPTCKTVFNSVGENVYHKITERHDVLENKLKINCTDCSKTFIGLAPFYRHAKRECHIDAHINKVVINSFCKLCNCNVAANDLGNHARLDSHVGQHAKYLYENSKNMRFMKKRKSVVKMRFKCHVCHKRLKTKLEWLSHARTHGGFNRLFTCQICKSVFNKSDYLKRHMRHVHMPHEFSCNKCKKSFTYRYLLKLHKMSTCSS